MNSTNNKKNSDIEFKLSNEDEIQHFYQLKDKFNYSNMYDEANSEFSKISKIDKNESLRIIDTNKFDNKLLNFDNRNNDESYISKCSNLSEDIQKKLQEQMNKMKKDKIESENKKMEIKNKILLNYSNLNNESLNNKFGIDNKSKLIDEIETKYSNISSKNYKDSDKSKTNNIDEYIIEKRKINDEILSSGLNNQSPNNYFNSNDNGGKLQSISQIKKDECSINKIIQPTSEDNDISIKEVNLNGHVIKNDKIYNKVKSNKGFNNDNPNTISNININHNTLQNNSKINSDMNIVLNKEEQEPISLLKISDNKKNEFTFEIEDFNKKEDLTNLIEYQNYEDSFQYEAQRNKLNSSKETNNSNVVSNLEKYNYISKNDLEIYREIVKNNTLIKESDNEWEKKLLIRENKELEKKVSPSFLVQVHNNQKFNKDK